MVACSEHSEDSIVPAFPSTLTHGLNYVWLYSTEDWTPSHLNRAVSRVETKPMDRKLRAVLLLKADLFFPAFSLRISESLL